MSNAISDEILRKAEALKTVLNQAPRAVGAMAVDHFKDNFRRGGFDGNKWAKRKRETKKSRGRAILVKSARLMNSIRSTRETTEEVVIGTDVPYARIHNEGGEIHQAPRSETFQRGRSKKGRFTKGSKAGQGFTFKARTIKMPQRRFIGESKVLTGKVSSWYEKSITNALNAK